MKATEERTARKARELGIVLSDIGHLEGETRDAVISSRVQWAAIVAAERLYGLNELARDLPSSEQAEQMLAAGEEAGRRAFHSLCLQLDELGFGPRF